MKLTMQQITHGEEEVIVKYLEKTPEIERLVSLIRAEDRRLIGWQEKVQTVLEPGRILYFESVDNRTFLYTSDEVMEIKHRLYELEVMLPPEDFFRISKAQIVNINRVRMLAPGFNRTLFATMTNGEQVYISRKYAVDLRSALSI